MPNSEEQKPHFMKPESTLYRQNIIDDFVEKIIEPQLKQEKHQKHEKGMFDSLFIEKQKIEY